MKKGQSAQIPQEIQNILVKLGLPPEGIDTTDGIICRIRYNFQGKDEKGTKICVSGGISGIKFSMGGEIKDFALFPENGLVDGHPIHSLVYFQRLLWDLIMWPDETRERATFLKIKGKLKLEKIEQKKDAGV